MARALFLDRDGIFNELVVRDEKFHSPRTASELRRYPLGSLKKIKNLGYHLILITNQPDLERGLVELSFIEKYHQDLQRVFELDAIYLCPFQSNQHLDKKPNPGMLLQAQRDWGLDFQQCFFLGDTQSDVGAAQAVSCKSILWDRDYNRSVFSDFRIKNLEEVFEILKQALTS